MAKDKNRGKVIGKVNGLTLRKVDSYTGYDKNRKLSGSKITVSRGKKIVDGGSNFKNKESATKFAENYKWEK